MKSNITIKSNIYIRITDSVANDVNFVKNVRGLKAIKKVSTLLSSISRSKLTQEQRDFSSMGISCERAKDGQSTHGMVFKDDKLQLVCRCEYSQCEDFNKGCKGFIQPINRTFEDSNELETTSTQYGFDLSSIVDKVGIDYQNEEIFKGSSALLPNDTHIDKTSNANVGIDTSNDEYVTLSSKDSVIQSAVDSKVLINAGAGTGKTYTVINRILYLLKNALIAPDEILVICYTRSAKKVIEDRISAEVANGSLPYTALGICLFTLDSLATNYLLNFVDEDITTLNYNERIELFNNRVSKENFDVFKYLIVDEIQDLVNGRATMLLKILECVSCGYMLLGDKCQAIYDYSCNDEVSISSLDFYKLLETQTTLDHASKYEFTQNMRQSNELLELSSQLRNSILNDSLENQVTTLDDIVSKLKVCELPAESVTDEIIHGKTAILTRNNGEAEYIHTNLLERGVKHSITRGNQGKVPLNRDIATIFWDYCKSEISKENFILRYQYRISNDAQKAEEYFNILKDFSNQDNPISLNMNALVNAFQTNYDVPKELLPHSESNLVVSTIHKAKGQEFDTVYLLDDNISKNSEELRVKYVSLTRAKNDLKILKKRFSGYWYFQSSKYDGRVISCSNHFRNTFCSGVSFGLSDEIEKSSFVTCIDGKFRSPVEVQRYIANNVSVGDTVDLTKFDDVYYIYHEGTVIGKMSHEFNKSLKKSMQGVTYRNNLPLKILNVHISNVVTFVDTSYFETDFPIYKQSKIFLGIELSGIGKTQFK